VVLMSSLGFAGWWLPQQAIAITCGLPVQSSPWAPRALLQLYLLGNRLGSGHLLIVRTAARLTEDPQCAHRDAAADALRRYLVKWRHTACREVVTSTARRLQQSDSAGQARAAKLLGVLDPA
jgi:hypothetical protein